MNSDIVIRSENHTWAHVDCSDAIAAELHEYFTYAAPGAQFMKRQTRFRHWDGRIRLFKLKDHRIYRGLIPRIHEFAEAREYTVGSTVPDPVPFLPDDTFDTWLDDLHLPFAPRDYQLEAVRRALDLHRGVILSPTGSGKSAILYLIQAAIGAKTLIVVPTIGLVGQMIVDFQSYGCDEPIHAISAGAEKCPPKMVEIESVDGIIYWVPGKASIRLLNTTCKRADELQPGDDIDEKSIEQYIRR